MAINKNFVVKNGIEVNTNLIVADTDSNKVGIGTTVPEYTLHVFEGAGIGVTNITVTGISTNLDELNVGVGGTTLTAISNATLGIGGSVGVGTDAPGYLLEVHSPVTSGQTALYVRGDMVVTGDINIDDISIGDLNVSGISTFVGNILVGTGATVGFGSTAFFKDYAKAIFGDGEDLKVYHDGSNSYISDSGTGGLIVGSNSLTIKNGALNETQAVFTENGAVELYYDNTKRLETTVTGVDVTGTFRSTGITTLASSGGITTTGGDLYVGGDLFINEDIILDTNLTILGIATIGSLNLSSTSGINTIDSTVQSTSKDTGSLVLQGGLGVEKQLYVGAGASIGAGLTVAGNLLPEADGTRDLGASGTEWKDLYIDGTANIDSLSADTAAIGDLTDNRVVIAGSSGELEDSADLTFDGTTLAVNAVFDSNDATQSSSSTTGAAQFAGGVGVAKNLYVGGGQVTTGIHTITDLRVGTQLAGQTLVGITTILDEDNMASDSAAALATQQSIKAYVDAQVTASDLDFAGDSGGAQSVDLDSQTFTIAGTTNEIETSSSGQTLTVGLPNDVTIGGELDVTTLDVSGNADIDGHTELDNLNVSGIATFASLDVQTNFDVYDPTATFHNNVFIAGNLSIGGTTTVLLAEDLFVIDKTIVLGVTTSNLNVDISTDNSANGGGISIASTEGNPLVSLQFVGVNTLPNTHKKILWSRAGTYGVGTTDAWLFNYAVGVGSTQVPNGVRFAVSEIQFTDDTINTPNINVAENANVTGDLDVSGNADIDGHTELDNVNVAGFSTFVSNVIIGTGATVGFGSTAFFRDEAKAIFGTGEDLQIYHDGSNSRIVDAGSGELRLDSNSLRIRNAAGTETSAVFVQDGKVELRYDNVNKFETGPAGTITVGVGTFDGLSLGDNEKALFGAGDDLQIYHAGSHTHIREIGAGALKIEGANINIDNADGSKRYIDCNDGGSVELYYDNSKRLETTADGVDFSGTGSIKVPVGTTAQRNASPTAGDFRYNSTTGDFEGYTDSWGAIAGGGGSETDTSVSSTSATSIYTTPHATNRSVSAIIQITQGTSYQVGRYLVIHDGTTATIVEESAVATGDMLGSFTADINSTNLRILVNMASASSATVTIIPTVVTV
jgi:hypothetical protein